MPFNWFKRQFGGKKNDEAPVKEEVTSSPEKQDDKPASESERADSKGSEPTVSDSSTTDTTPANAQDYLQWAKAAYQSIQTQQEGDTVADGETVDTKTADTDDDAEPDTDDAPAALETASAEDVIATEISAAADDSPAPVTDDVIVTEPSSEPVAAIPDTPSEDTSTASAADTAPVEEAVVEEAVADLTDSTSPDVTESDVSVTDESLAEAQVTAETVATDDAIAPPETDSTTLAEADSAQVSEPVADVQSPESSTIDSPQAAAITEDAAVQGAPPSDTTVEDDAPAQAVPFWAKAEAERQERLERVKETAIEEPEEEPDTSSAAPGVEFDEDFVWSAGVLAAQGRRPEEVSVEEITWLTKLRQGLGKTRRGLINQLKSVVGQGPLNADAVMEIESLLIQADVGIDATDYVIEALQNRMKEGALPPEEAIAYLKDILRGILDKPFESEYSTEFVPEKDCLNIWLLTGVNGAGKTTTIGKLAHMTRTSDYRCLIAAADTFRAAAVEQVKVWGDRSGVEVIANPGQNTDPAAVVFDAITAAKSRDVELLLVDTAGRLQNKKNLMAELSKIRRIVDKKAADAKIESLLVLDATLGQNGLRQAQVFSEAAKLSGVVLTKLDGSAKGGVALAVVQQLGLPIRFIGAGEGIEDLRPFSSYEFVEALLSG